MSAPRPLADLFRAGGGGAAAAAALLLAPSAEAEPLLSQSAMVEELTRGLFCAASEGGRMEAPDTEFGWIHIPQEPVAMRRPGSLAPAVLGIGFGVEFTLTGTQPVLVRHVVRHPPMPPSGRVEQSWESWIIGGVAEVVFFQFDIDPELLPGRWSFTALAGEDELYHAEFDIVPADQAPHLAGLCVGGDLLTFSR